MLDVGERSRVHRQLEVRVGDHAAVAGEVLADRDHPRVVHPLHPGAGELGDGLGIAMERPVADHRAEPAVEIEHRRERQVEPAGAQLRRHQPTGEARRLEPARPVLVEQLTVPGGRRQACHALAEALHAAAFLVRGNDERGGAQLMNGPHQPIQLIG